MARALNNHVPTLIDFVETVMSEIDIGTVKAITPTVISTEGMSETGFTFRETQETVEGLDDQDQLLYESPEGDSVTRWFRMKAEVNAVDAGIGLGEEGVDLIDFAVMVNGSVVATSNEGPLDAADTVSFTLDTYVPLDNEDEINFVIIGSNTEGDNEEFDVTVEADEAQVYIT